MCPEESGDSMPNPSSEPQISPGGDAGRAATWFVIKLVVLTLVLGFGEAILMQKSHDGGEGEWLFRLREFVAWSGATLAGVFDSRVTRESVLISGAGPDLIVSVECTALFATALYCAAAIAYPARWRERWVGFAVGLVGVAILNVLRIAGLTLIAGYIPSFFHFAHLVLMQWFLISCVAPMWLAWAVWATKRGQEARG